jgi:Holliday junction resolvasome RuvABC endonuclease subunit
MGHTCGYKLPYELHSFSSPPAGDNAIRRTARFEDLVARIMEPLEKMGTFDVICIEYYAHTKNPKTTIHLAEFGGILRFHLTQIAAQIYEPAPSTLKKFCCGSGAPGKVGTATALVRDYGVNFGSDDNQYDAFGLYRMALVLAGGAECRTRAQREAIDTVLGLKTKTREERSEKALEKLFTNPPPF